MRHALPYGALLWAVLMSASGCILFVLPDDGCWDCSDSLDHDTDGDGLTNDDEWLCGTDPDQYDSDRDGVSDSLEDSDCDGHSNGRELSLGTDCGNADERPSGSADCDDVCDRS